MDKASSTSITNYTVDELLIKAEKEAAQNLLDKYRKLQCRSYLMMRYIELKVKEQQTK